MKRLQYNIKLPAIEPHLLEQNESFFFLAEDEGERKIGFHDYGEIFKRQGLYEQLFYQRLKCISPKKVSDILAKVLKDNRVEMSELRVLDIGVGNGMFGEQLHTHGIARVIGVDISEEAQQACLRDRPGIYDAYYLSDLATVTQEMAQELKAWQLDCLSCVAALGFSIPTRAFANAFNLIATGGWVAFNIKETFLLESDASGFSRLIKSLMFSDALEVHHLERYRHRISIDGRPLFYYAIVGKKEFNIPEKIMAKLD